jgi:hypothetical protein
MKLNLSKEESIKILCDRKEEYKLMGLLGKQEKDHWFEKLVNDLIKIFGEDSAPALEMKQVQLKLREQDVRLFHNTTCTKTIDLIDQFIESINKYEVIEKVRE